MQDHPTKRDYATDGGIARRKEREREKLSGKETIKIKREMSARREREKREKSERERGCAHSLREREEERAAYLWSHLHRHYAFRPHVP